MRAPPQVRRPDKLMTDVDALAFLDEGYCGRLGTVGADGKPYVTPLLYVLLDGMVWVHNTAARGHLRSNLEANPKVCFEVDEAGDVFAYGRFECDTSIAYRSVVAFGAATVVREAAEKARFCDALMAKYGPRGADRPAGFYPRLGAITVYRMTIERLTGKRTELPPPSAQWPALDRSASPDAKAP